MNIKVEKVIYLQLDKKEVGLFSILLKLGLRGLKDMRSFGKDSQFRMMGEDITSYEEAQLFIEDLMRGISK